MKKKLNLLVLILGLVLLVSCGQKKTEKVTETDANSALMYTFTMGEHDYRFRLLDNWKKYPNTDESIAFLVGNQKRQSFMTAGFELKNQSLDEYKDEFMEKTKDTLDSITLAPEKKKINGLDAYYLEFTMKDNKERLLTYKTYLIETEGYFVNLAAWTSAEEPSEEILVGLDKILVTFEQLK